ncbi:MAG: HisA/HisF-related TIM barrel protein [Methyloglobulus sp.]|nr:nickel transporter [Methyloglobulus sp.]
MQIIPVIDLKNGIVVHAKQGDRDHYAPLKSELCKTPDIFTVVNVYKMAFGFSTIYIADLDAITRQGHNGETLNKILAAFPEINFWIDSGYPICDDRLLRFDNFLPVFGSESFDNHNVAELSRFKRDFILSLDYSVTGEMGAKKLFSQPELWPSNVIIMSLPNVGSNLGPDIERLATYRNEHPEHNIIASGGVRNYEDLRALRKLGIEQVLVATALHNGSINPDGIANL